MPKHIRIQALLTAKQYASLKRMSQQTDVPVLAIIRRAIDQFLGRRAA